MAGMTATTPSIKPPDQTTSPSRELQFPVVQVMAPNRKIFALKRIKLQGKDSEASKGFVDEITLLQRLRGKQNIIQLVDAEVCVHIAFADTATHKALTAQLTALWIRIMLFMSFQAMHCAIASACAVCLFLVWYAQPDYGPFT